MRRVKRFLQLTGAERTIFLQAALSLILIRLTLGRISLRAIRRLALPSRSRTTNACAPEHLAWAVASAARFVPGSTCLVRALAIRILLIRHGYDPQVIIGVAKNESLPFEAHAWVACQGQIVMGGPDVGRYTALMNLGSSS